MVPRMLSTGLVVVAVLHAAGDKPINLALPGLSAQGFSREQAEFFTEHLALALRQQGVDVVTPREIGALLGLERQKQLLGCSDGADSCTVELANALGADGVLLGDVGKVGDRIQINLKVLNPGTARAIALFARGVTGDGAVLDALTAAAPELVAQAAKALGRSAGSPRGGERRPVGWWWVPGAAGVALAGAGVGLLVAGNQTAELLRTSGGTLTAERAADAVAAGKVEQRLGVGLAIAGAAGLAASVVLLVATNAAVSPVAWIDASGGVFGLGGHW